MKGKQSMKKAKSRLLSTILKQHKKARRDNEDLLKTYMEVFNEKK